ncbi:MAG: RNA polymerase subunit sigma [Planctomycetes bacterium]|nr:RNA polymerase subunit sigma [Planctomycetota bacterium]
MVDADQSKDGPLQDKRQSTEELLPVFYAELRRLAAYLLAGEKPGQTLQATEVLHEAILRLLRVKEVDWENPRHFFGSAAKAMRQILIERARKKSRIKNGSNPIRDDGALSDLAVDPPSLDLLALNEALERLEQIDPAAVELVQLRYFIGLTMAQCACILGIGRRSADNLWAFAKAYLYREIRGAGPEP